MLKIDTHVHTCEVSSCGRVAAVEAVRLYKAAGYDGIVITDHYYKGFFDGQEGTWREKIEKYSSGYELARQEGERSGLTVLLGMELRVESGCEDYLVYGVNKEFLCKYPELYLLSMEDFKKVAEENCLLVFQAHPFRPFMNPAPPEVLDGIEVYNGNPRHNSNNPAALEYAQKHNLLMISGSDFHQPEDLARGGIALDKPVSDTKELVEVILKGSYRLMRDGEVM